MFEKKMWRLIEGGAIRVFTVCLFSHTTDKSAEVENFSYSLLQTVNFSSVLSNAMAKTSGVQINVFQFIFIEADI